MLDIKFIRENAEQVKEAARVKQLDPAVVDQLLAADERRRGLIQQIDDLRAAQNAASKERNVARGKELKIEIQKLEPELRQVQQEFGDLMLLIPNIPAPEAPIGRSDEENRVVSEWGKIPQFDFPIKDHIELAESLDLIDFAAGVKTSGFRGYYLKNEAALMHLGILLLGIETMREAGFTMTITPTILREFALIGSGHFPFGRDEVYQIANPGKIASGEVVAEPAFLSGTAEPALLAYHADKVFEEKDLPVKLCGFSPCYRSEVGSYGKDTRGIYRIHEFMKVEQVVICRNDVVESDRWLNQMLEYSKSVVEALELPYRVVDVCTGDMGAGKRRMYDLETWMPSRNGYGETHSDSNLTDWQARRLNIKYRDASGDIKYCHCLNNTVIASPRILIAVLECNQQADGSVKVPKVLQDFVGKKIIASDAITSRPNRSQ